MFILAIAALLAVLIACLLPGVIKHGKKNASHRSMSQAGFRPLSFSERLAAPFVAAMVVLQTGWRDLLAPTRLIASNIAEGVHEASVTKLTDAAISTRHLLYKQGSDANHVAVITSASDIAIGTVPDEASAAEEYVEVKLLGKGGTTKMVSNGTVVAGGRVYQTSAGKVASTGTIAVGIALTSGAVDGDVVEVADVSLANSPATRGITATAVAAAGSTVADAGQLAASAVVTITSDGATKGVKLPTGAAGMVIDVLNGSATACELYAASGGTVNGLAADASVVVPASKGLRCFCTAADTWIAYDLPAKATAS